MKRIKKPVSILLAVIMVVSLFSIVPAAADEVQTEQLGNYDYTVGTDEKGSYYAVDSALALFNLSSYSNFNNDFNGMRFKQTADIEMDGWDWYAIGDTIPFRGIYDGDGYVIRNIGNPNGDSGMFGKLNGTVKNVNLKDCSFSGGCVGSIASETYNEYVGEDEIICTIENCNVIGGTVTGSQMVGGLVGYLGGGEIIDCFTNVSVSGDAVAKGPVVGHGSDPDCYFTDIPDGASNRSGYQVENYPITTGSGITVSGNFRTVGRTAGNIDYFGEPYDNITLSGGDAPEGYTVIGYQSNDVEITDGSFTMPKKAVSVTAVFGSDEPDHLSVSADGNFYTINDAEGWDNFCDLLKDNDKGYFDDKTVLLGDDIAVTRMAGGSYHDFTGTFNGLEHTLTVNYGTAGEPVGDDNKVAPFRNVEDGCVIKNLHTAGTIYTSKKFASGLIGTMYGTVKIENCRSSVTINSSTGGDGTHGGFVGNNGTGSDLTIDGCVFDGKILSTGETATTSCSGFVGYKHNSVTITNSIYDPAALESSETEASSGSATFVRNGEAGDNCYYTRAFGSVEDQGEQAYTISAGENVTLAFSGEATEYNVSGITAYRTIGVTNIYNTSGITAKGTGLAYNGNFYAGEGDKVTLTLGYNGTPTTGCTFTGYTASAGALENGVLTMPDSDVVINAAYAQNDYTITTSAEHGTITVTVGETQNAATAHYNDTVLLTVDPDSGYGVKSVSVNDGAVEVTKNQDGSYSFQMPAQDVTVSAEFQDAVPYIDENGEEQLAADYQVLRMTDHQLTEGWYYIDKEIDIDSQVNCTGDVRLILKDGVRLAVAGGRYQPAVNIENGSLTVYGQSKGTGMLLANGFDYGITIGAESELVINGGKITVEGYDCGIHGGLGTGVTVNGGSVTSQGSPCGFELAGRVLINGGSVDFSNSLDGISAGEVVINGGQVEVKSIISDSSGGGVVLGADRSDDYIKIGVKGLQCHSTVKVMDGQVLTDGENTYSGTLNSGEITRYLARKTLVLAHTVTIEDGITNGAVTADKDFVAANADDQTVTLNVVPAEGYAVKYVKYNDTVIEPKNCVYSFEMPDEDVIVTAEFDVPKDPVTYLDEYGRQQSVIFYDVLSGGEPTLDSGWYVVSGDTEFSGRITVNGDVSLILCDDSTLKNEYDIFVTENSSLTIYAQSADSSMGSLKILLTADRMQRHCISGTVTINGGNISVSEPSSSYRNYTPKTAAFGDITVNGGRLSAKGGEQSQRHVGSAAIGGNVTINGGEVIATGGYECAGIGDGTDNVITINGGTVTATGSQHAAGIGFSDNYNDSNGSTTVINGGNVTANEGSTSLSALRGKVTIGYTNASDSIYASSVRYAVVTVAEGKTLSDGNGNIYTSETPSGTFEDQTDITLTPAYFYDVNVHCGEHGTVTAPAYGAAGGAVTFTVTPDEGCIVRFVEVDNTLIEPKNGVYKFDMPDHEVNLRAVFCTPKDPVTYLDENGETQTAVYYELFDGTEYELETGWYVLSSDITYSDWLAVSGDVHLILCDGCTMIANNGVRVFGDNSLTIYAQSADGGAGKLNAKATTNLFAGIGGYSNESGGNITINGGTVTAEGAEGGAGIGGGADGFGGTITINDGTVTAAGGDGGAGIGTGNDCLIIGGARFTEITINGGTVTATGGSFGSGIGGGYDTPGGDVAINGGKVTATGGTLGSGIGGGSSNHSGTVTLSYTTPADFVYASSFDAAVSVSLGKRFIDGNGTIYSILTSHDTFRHLRKVMLAPYDGIGARLVGHSLSLEGDIGVNFYMMLSDEIAASQTAYMQFTIPNGNNPYTAKVYVNEQEDTTLPYAEKNGNYYVFKCNVSAKEIKSTIKAQLIDGEDQGFEYTYSVREYADYLLAHTDENEEYAKAAPLVNAMLTYGDYAKEYFDKTDTLPELDNVLIDEQFAAYESELPDGLFDGATLSLKTQTTLSLYFNDEDKLTFSCVDENGRKRQVKTVRDGSTQIARIRNIAAAELQYDYTLTVKKGDTVIGTITYSPMNYCYRACDSGTDNTRLQNVAKALYVYSQAAKSYFGEEGE